MWVNLSPHVSYGVRQPPITLVTEIRLLDLTLPDLVANLALDEALLEEAEASDEPAQLLRLWESPAPMVVVGRASKVRAEVNVPGCRAANVPIYRRCSGGTSVVAGPGCLMYAVVLSYQRYPQLRTLDRAHAFVMNRMRSGLVTLESRVQYQGTSDLTLGDRKFSGNSLRCKRQHLLYHGTVLYDFPLQRISEWLDTPPRQPEYREGREHARFLTNLSRSVTDIRNAIVDIWNAHEPCEAWPKEATEALVEGRYSQERCNFRF